MQAETGETFELMDIMRYFAPHNPPSDTPEKVLEALREYTPKYLFDIYLLAGEVPVRALVHPSMYTRILKGWLKIGSVVRVLETEGDMIVSMESTGEVSERDLTKIKKDIYITLPNPIFNEKGYYMPLLADEGYMKWDRRWKRYLERHFDMKEDREIVLKREPEKSQVEKITEDDTVSDKTPYTVICPDELEEEERLFKSKRIVTRVGYTETQRNIIRGQVILKSRLFTFTTGRSFPLFFSFILLTKAGVIKVYVWELAVRKFFCVKEGDYVAIRGFKVKRRKGCLPVGDRVNTDSDTKYGSIPEINVNLTDPVGYVMKTEEISDLPNISKDEEFTTVIGVVEYISSLLRYAEKESPKKFKEYVFLRVSGIPVKLISNGSLNSVLDIKRGSQIEIRHLRKGAIGSFEFYVSSLYTQFYDELSDAPLFDKEVITGNPVSFTEENAVGYIPVCFRLFSEHVEAQKDGVGLLKINGVEIPRESHESGYLKKDRKYFGELCTLSEAFEKISSLYMDETKRFIVFGKILGIKYDAKEDSEIGSSAVEVSYIASDSSIGVLKDSKEGGSVLSDCTFNRVEESIVLRVGSEEAFIDLQLFQNHLVYSSFEESVFDFLKIERSTQSIYKELEKTVGEKYYFVFDAIRVNEEIVLHVGVSLLR